MSSFAHTAEAGAVLSPTLPAIQQWRRQIGCRTRLAEERGPRPLALISYRIRGQVESDFVPIERLTFVALFDEQSIDGRLATWVLGCGAVAADGGIRIGQPSRFAKDLRLPPHQGGRGPRFDAADESELLQAALCWERHLERQARHPFYPRRTTIRFPDWWCAVSQAQSGMTVRRVENESFVPLEEAVAAGLSLTTVRADLTHVPKRQVLAADSPARSLCGTAGPVKFDLYHSRFRSAT